MKLRAPNYYKKFHCIADKCKNSCCSAGWEIDIDEDTANYYSKVPGSFGEKLNKNITVNSDGSSKCFKLDINKNCPFFNNKKLCEIYINLGEEHLCQICTEHPRYYEWFKNLKEVGIGLCCEEAARIILIETEPFSTYEINIPYEDYYEYNNEIYSYLYSAREKIFNYINTNTDLNACIRNILWYCNTIQENIDNNLFDEEIIFDVKSEKSSDIIKILEFFLTLETNNDSWITYLKKCINIYKQQSSNLFKFEKQNPEISNYLKNIANYFIWRYFLKGTFDEEIISKISLMAISVYAIKILFFCKWIENAILSLDDCIDIVRNFSEEIEYDEDNLNKLADACYELDDFNLEKLMGLFN